MLLEFTTSAPKATTSGKKPEGWSFDSAYDMPDTASGWIEKFGDDTILDFLVANTKIVAQSAIRRQAEAGLTDQEISEAMKHWVPGQKITTRGKRSPVDLVKDRLATLSTEERAAFLAEIQERIETLQQIEDRDEE